MFRGIEGYGDTAEIHRRRLLSHEEPVVITIIDSEAQIECLLPALAEMIGTALIVTSDVQVKRVQRPPMLS